MSGVKLNKQRQGINEDMSQLAKDAGVLIAATVDMAGAEIKEARDHLTDVLELGKVKVGRVGDLAMQKAKVVSAAMHENPYRVMGLGIGVGVLIGFLASSRWAGRCDRKSQEKSNS